MIKTLKVKIRPYMEEDLEGASKVAYRAFKGTLDAKWAIWGLNRCEKVLVAEIDENIVGVVELESFWFKNILHGYIYYIFVDPDWQRQGVGSALLRGAESYFKEQGAKYIWATTGKRNFKAKKFFEKNKYKNIDPQELKKKYSRREFKYLLWHLYYWSEDVIYLKNIT